MKLILSCCTHRISLMFTNTAVYLICPRQTGKSLDVRKQLFSAYGFKQSGNLYEDHLSLVAEIEILSWDCVLTGYNIIHNAMLV